METRTIHGEQCRTIFFIGKPGCGKGTQAKLLSEKTSWPVFASGDLFRTIATEETPVGRKVRSEVDAGMLTPHWFAMYLYLKALFAVRDGESVIFDGFNRKVQEAELVIDSLKWLNRPFTILNIRVSDEEVLKRLAKRKEMEGRTDDSVVEERLKEYREHTGPAIEKFKEAGTLVEINGEQTPEEIAVDINKELNIA
jgi:adenylate kinase